MFIYEIVLLFKSVPWYNL